MTPISIICPLCGHSFESAGHGACQACPLNRGCQMVCCPKCGYSTVDVQQSRAARLVSRLIKGTPRELSR